MGRGEGSVIAKENKGNQQYLCFIFRVAKLQLKIPRLKNEEFSVILSESKIITNK